MFKELFTEAISQRNPYLKMSERDLQRKLKSFNIQIADLERKGHMGSDEYNELAMKRRQVEQALKDT